MDFDAEPEPARRTPWGNVDGSDHDRLMADFAAFRRQFRMGRSAYDALLASSREAAASARARIAQLEAQLHAALERVDALQAAVAQAERSERERRVELATTQEALAAATRARVAADEQIATLWAADEARKQRLADALADAATVVDGLAFAATELAALAQPGAAPPDEGHLDLVLRRLFPRLVDRVSVCSAGRAQREMVAALRDAPAGRRTWETGWPTDAGERPLDSSAALANDVVVLVDYKPGVFPDGDIPALVERICHALAASVDASRRARLRAGERGPVTMLADEDARERLQALCESRGDEMARVSLMLGAQLCDVQIGLYGSAAWDASVFDCAGRLDGLARDHGGEAFELQGAICCLVRRAHAAEVAQAVREVAEALGFDAEVDVS